MDAAWDWEGCGVSKHTPGPWIVTPDPYGIGDAMIGIDGGKPDHVACCALKDAALIAAAPVLLAALEEIAKTRIGLDIDGTAEEWRDYWAARCQQYRNIARAALAKVNAP